MPDRQARLDRLGRLAWLLDSSIAIPGTGLSVGLDALIGLFPVVGDLIGVALSAYILKEAHALGVGKSVLARMAFNIVVEGVVGAVPVAGDVFDAAWKANQRNVRLLYAWEDRPRKEERAGWLFLAGLVGALLIVLVAAGVTAWLLITWLLAIWA
jgi:hypothetical protein